MNKINKSLVIRVRCVFDWTDWTVIDEVFLISNNNFSFTTLYNFVMEEEIHFQITFSN